MMRRRSHGLPLTAALLASIAASVIAAPAGAGSATSGNLKVRNPGLRPLPLVGKAAAPAGAASLPQTAGARVSIGGSVRAPIEVPRRGAPMTLDERTAARIEEVLRGPLRNGTTAIYVVDAMTGDERFSIHPDDPLNPASNVKLVATATALDILGPEYRYLTRLFGPTPDAGGVVHGDVYLLGSYDPTLSRADLDRLANLVASSGIRRIEGDVVTGGTPTRDGIFRARARVEVRAGAPGEAPVVEVLPSYDFVTVEVTATTVRGRRGGLSFREEMVTTETGQPRLKLFVEGSIGHGRTFVHWVWPRERGLHTAHLLRAALRQAGVDIAGDAHVAEFPEYVGAATRTGWLPIELGAHRSARLADIITRVNKRSINWLADRVIMTAAAVKYREKPSMARAIDAMYDWLEASAGISRSDIVIDSGSGLSYKTEFSVRQIVKVLRTAGGLSPISDPVAQPAQEVYLGSLSVGGVDGTLRSRFKTPMLAGKVRGKTGTLDRVIALAGVLDVGPGQSLAFSMVSNGHPPWYKHRVRAAHEKMVGILSEYLIARGTPAGPAAPAIAAPVVEEPPVPSMTRTEAAPTVDEEPDDAEVGADPLADEPVVSAPAP